MIVTPITHPHDAHSIEGSGSSPGIDDEPDTTDEPEESETDSPVRPVSPPSTVSSTPVPVAYSTRHPAISPQDISSTSNPWEEPVDGPGGEDYPPEDPEEAIDPQKKRPKLGSGSENDNGINDNSIEVKNEARMASFFAQPGILAAVIGGAVLGLLFAVLLVMFILYRIRKKDEGVYTLEDPKRVTYTRNDY